MSRRIPVFLPTLLVMLAIAALPVRSQNAGHPKLPLITVQGTSFELVRIPAGEFEMGSDEDHEKPRHRVRVRSFDMGNTEVTVRQFRAFVEKTGYRTDAEKEGWAWICCWSKREAVSWRNPGFTQSEDDPVVAISWNDAEEFCKWMSATTGESYRLPSEAEWEYAARAGTTAESPDDLDQVAWYRKNSDGRTHAVKGKKPNSFGLHDVLGNAWEWTADVWADTYDDAPKDGTPRRDGGSRGQTFAAGEGRVLRGGAWGLDGPFMRLSSRPGFGLHERCNNSGFRIVRSIPVVPGADKI